VSRLKFPEREMEDRTNVVRMHLDDLRIGVKSQSNSAMAGSCGNVPQYSLIVLGGGVKYGWSSQTRKGTGLIPTQNLSSAFNRNGGQCVRYCSETGTTETGVKVPKYILSVTKGVSNLRQ